VDNQSNSFRKPAFPRPDAVPQPLLAPDAVREVLTAVTGKFPERRDPDSRAPQPAAHSLLDIPAVATRLGVSSKTVRRLIDRGELAVHRIGRLLRVSEADLHSNVARQRQVQSKERA
jgi:excisionase family DNA binding protein